MLNLNIGILGHVDCGKTTLAKALSEIGSTAAFDKNPQSQARGITLDLGFSSLCIDVPEHLQTVLKDRIQLTLVDCPGHASLIRTIIGGAQIIDLILLVIDVTKGIQTQTAECLVIGEIMCSNMIVVLNKIDLLMQDKKTQQIEKMKKRLKQILSSTCFAEAPVVTISALFKDGEDSLNLDNLLKQISLSTFIPARNQNAPFLFAIDHCFGIKGKGTVLTGTVLQGNIKVDDTIDLPLINATKKIKSMQMFKKPVTCAWAGDRLGICVTQFDPKLMERGIACAPGLANWIYCAILPATKIKYFKGQISSKSKYHISIGHETSMALITCFNGVECVNKQFDFSMDYEYSECIIDEDNNDKKQFLLLEFDKPVLTVDNSMIIGSKFDMDIHKNDCRIAFWGKLLSSSTDKEYKSKFLPSIKIYRNKMKSGTIDRVVNDNVAIVKNMFKKETNLDLFSGLEVCINTEVKGIIEGSFGQSGKVKIYCRDGLGKRMIDLVNVKNKNTADKEVKNTPVTVTLKFKRYIYDTTKRIVQ